jgi:hypothetical protein
MSEIVKYSIHNLFISLDLTLNSHIESLDVKMIYQIVLYVFYLCLNQHFIHDIRVHPGI